MRGYRYRLSRLLAHTPVIGTSSQVTGSRTLPYGTGGREEEEKAYGAHSHGSSQPLCSGLICTRETALMGVAQRLEHPSGLSPFSANASPLPYFHNSLLQPSCCHGRRARPEEAAGPRGKRLQWAAREHVWAREGMRGGHLTEPRSGGRGLFYIIVYVP